METKQKLRNRLEALHRARLSFQYADKLSRDEAIRKQEIDAEIAEITKVLNPALPAVKRDKKTYPSTDDACRNIREHFAERKANERI